MSMRTGASVALLGIAMLAAGCGRSGDASKADLQPAPERSSAHVPPRDQPQVFARDAQLMDGSTVTLLRMPIGRLQASCRDGDVMTAFESMEGRSADVVVQSGARTRSGSVNQYRGNRNLGTTFIAPRLALPGFQTWSIAEMAEAAVRPTMIIVAAKPSAGDTLFRCAVSAFATAGAPTGTITK